jgi:hypothetical protein
LSDSCAETRVFRRIWKLQKTENIRIEEDHLPAIFRERDLARLW